ncbi:hypothetical protein MXB_1174 [Myxobolus squamalis]|nr:hypothetical protein MXB_1174 [Myxobolus squamalis]
MISEIKLRKPDENVSPNELKNDFQNKTCDINILRIQSNKCRKACESLIQEIAVTRSFSKTSPENIDFAAKVEKLSNKLIRAESKHNEILHQIQATEMKKNILNAKLRQEIYFEYKHPESGKSIYKWRQERKK